MPRSHRHPAQSPAAHVADRPRSRRAVGIALGGIAVALLAVGPARAEQDAELEDLARRASSFLRALSGDPETAFQDLLANSRLSGGDESERLIEAAKKLPDKYGAFVAAELVGTRRVGQDLVLLTFVYKSERFPIVWRFAYYRPRESAPWAVVSLRFDSKLLDLDNADLTGQPPTR